jgi:hypothetical protein
VYASRSCEGSRTRVICLLSVSSSTNTSLCAILPTSHTHVCLTPLQAQELVRAAEVSEAAVHVGFMQAQLDAAVEGSAETAQQLEELLQERNELLMQREQAVLARWVSLPWI